ncbi:ATP-binding cassette domain-containing protein [Nakamurella sp. YIM 132087]|uniref:ABC-type quaternary amine transporter n=1 Tax=Nakamurella alba TaxID=2665158 RepID=A0A7K1FM82_9ACTN|nr:ABC transporter ATP-binding protein [Nakamurella alba]MTD15216.1 ATP-binding cassette domain-containing protein [Nakamurella alba]
MTVVTDTAIASIDHVSKTYPGASVPAVDDVTLDLRPGEFFSLLGPSGCGKSTLLRIVGGFEKQSAGTVVIAGQDMGTRPANRRPTNMVFQHLGLFPHLTVTENVAFGLRIAKTGTAERKRIVGEALEMVELHGFDDRKPAQLSGGQQQRVAIARALVNRPAVLLLDEPLAALDLKLRQQMHEVLKDLQRTSDTTFLFVTHDQSEAMVLSDRLGVMQDGKLCQVGTAEQLYRSPDNLFVANFVGDANIITAQVDAGAAMVDGVRVAASGSRSGTALMVRPEDVVLTPTGEIDSGAAGPGLPATVTGATYLGTNIRYELLTEGARVLRAVRPPSARRLAIGDQVTAGWHPDDAVVLAS